MVMFPKAIEHACDEASNSRLTFGGQVYYNAGRIREPMSTTSTTSSKVVSLQRPTLIPDGDFLAFLGKRVRHLRSVRGMTRKIVMNEQLMAAA